MSTTEEALRKAMEQKAEDVRIRSDALQRMVEDAVRNALAGSQKRPEQPEPSPTASGPSSSSETYPGRMVAFDEVAPKESGQSFGWFNGISSIAVNIKIRMGEAKKGAVLFTSSTPGEGTTTVCSNTALTLAKLSSGNVLLIDCNSKHPDIHNKYKMESFPGLTDVLLGKTSWEHAVRKSNRKNYYVLPFGQASQESFSLLVSNRMEELLRGFKTFFDFVFIDTPPVLGNPETETIAPYVDASVLVIRANSTRREVAIRAVERLIRYKDFLGAIYNQQTFIIPKFLYKRLK